MPARQDIPANTKFGKLTIVQFVGHIIDPRNGHKQHRLFECLCNCGQTCVVRAGFLLSGDPRVMRRCCGCTRPTAAKAKRTVAAEDAAYAAGFFDGEGNISILLADHNKHKGKHHYYLIAQAANTNREVLDWMRERFGGTVAARRLRSPAYDHCKHAWMWATYSRQALYALQIMYPYLRVKRQEAEIAFKFAARIGNPNAYTFPKAGRGRSVLTAQEIALRESFRLELMALRRKHTTYGESPIS